MDVRDTGAELSQEGRRHAHQEGNEINASQTLPPVDTMVSDQHDLSYLAGPPYVAPGQFGEPKRYFQGLAENANTLGISKQDLLRSTAQSPFHSVHSATGDHSHLPVALQPTRIQHRYPHHPFFDCIPVPSFRDRAILAAAATPPLINRFDVCYDMFAGGLTYSGEASEEGSWSFSDAFREKWEALLTFDVVELQRQVDSQRES